MNKLEHLEQVIENLRHPKLGQTFWGWVATILLVFGLLWLKHSVWLEHPNDYFLAMSPDGLKNYMTTTWHVARDTTFTHYGGMNYPFGEHTLFTDNQPIFSSFLQWWHRNVSKIDQQVVGWLNLFQIFSVLLGATFIYLLFRKLHLPVWYAGLLATGMVFLSPQYNRFDAHFGLSHTFVIPAMLYFLCLYEERQSKRYQSLLLGILVWMAAQLHFYYFGMAAIFLTLYIGYQALRIGNWKDARARFFHWVAMVVLPFAALNLWLHWSDFATDRPATPFGFLWYIGFWEGVFLPPPEWPMYHWIEKNIIPIRKIDGEANAYAGFVATAFFAGLLGWGIFRRVRKIFVKENISEKTPLRLFRLFPDDWQKMAHHRVHQHFLRGIFTAAFGLLLFACGFIYTMKGMEWMINYFGPLRQFRGLGRFNWTFFYVINTLAFYLIWHHSRFFPMRWRRWFFYVAAIIGFYLIWNFVHHGPRRWEQGIFFLLEAAAIYGGLFWVSKKFQWFENWRGTRKLKIMQLAIAIVPLLILCWEAVILQKIKKTNPVPNLANREIFDKNTPDNWLKKVDFSGYQAILPLPYYHMGSENLWLDFDTEHFEKTQTTAIHTGLPDMGVNMSRTSCGQLVKSVQFILQPGQMPDLLNELPDNRPIALMVQNSKWDEVQGKYQHLLKNAEPLFSNEKLRLFKMNLSTVRQNVRDNLDEMAKEITTKTPLFGQGKWKSSEQNPFFIYQSFDSLTTTKFNFQGGGAFSGIMGDTTWIWKNSLPVGNYYLSFWTKATEDMGMNCEVKIIEKRNDGHEIQYRHEGMRHYVKMIVKDWALYDLPFEVKENGSRVNIFMKKETAENIFYLDEVLIKPNFISVFRTEPGWVAKNNFWYKN